MRKCLEEKPQIKHIAIDLPHLPEVSNMINDEDVDSLVEDYIERQSSCCKLKRYSERLKNLDAQGSKVINSKKHLNLSRKVNDLTHKHLRENDKELYFKLRQQDYFHFEIRECFMMTQILESIEEYNRPLIIIGYYHLPSISRKLKSAIKGCRIVCC